MKKIFGRAWRGALLNRKAFQEVYWDNDATADGVIVVASVQVVLFASSLLFSGVSLTNLLTGLLSSVVYGVASWLILAAVTWVAATKLFKQNGNIQLMMAMHGLAYLPLIVGLVPFFAASLVAIVWYLVVIVVATREAIESDIKYAALSVLVGYAVLAIIGSIFGGVFAAVPGL